MSAEGSSKSETDGMGSEKEELSREEIRRIKRKRERAQAIAILAGALVVAVLVISIIIGVVVHAISAKKDKKQEMLASQTEAVQEEESVKEEPESTAPEEEDVQTAEEPQEADAEPDGEDEIVTDGEEDTEEDQKLTGQDSSAEIEALVENQLSSMSLEQKVSQLFFLTPEQVMGRDTPVDSIGSDFNAKLNEFQVGGIVLREGNIKDADGIREITSNIGIMAQDYMFIGITEEGGQNSPFVQAEATENVLSSQREIGEEQGEAGAYSAGISIGSELKQYGFNLVFAPLADVATTGASLVADRTFGTDADTTAKLAKGVVQGLSDQGVVSCVKYFPSYGDVAQSRGAGQLISQKSKEDLAKDAQIYKTAIEGGADFLMISHVSLPKVRGDNRPASLSKEIITDIVRDEWGYDGVVITDYMDQACIYQKYTYAEAAVGAIEAGADMLLSTKNFQKSYNGIMDAVKSGTLTEERIEESVRRILRVKYRQKNS